MLNVIFMTVSDQLVSSRCNYLLVDFLTIALMFVM